MNRSQTHKIVSTLGALLLSIQIFMVSLHHVKHQHDNSITQECHLCLLHAQHHFIENTASFSIKEIVSTVFHEEIILLPKAVYASTQKEVRSLRAPPSF